MEQQNRQPQQKGRGRQQNQPSKQPSKQPPQEKPKPKPQQQPRQAAPKPKPQQQPRQAAPKPVETPQEPPPATASFLSHIPVVEKLTSQKLLERLPPSERARVHPALLEFALSTATDLSIDEDERTRRFLTMVMQLIKDEPVNEREVFEQTIFALLKRTLAFLSLIRVIPIGIENATRFIRVQNEPSRTMKPEERREQLLGAISHFIDDKIDDVFKFIADAAAGTISDGDVVMTYGWSSIICRALRRAMKQGKKFRVVVVDARPNFDSRRLIEEIRPLDVTYVLISGLSYVMPEVKKVLIEPYGILSNNTAVTPIGTSMVSMVAHEFRVPVIFVCGSYRFGTDVRIDSLTKNEVLSPDLVEPAPKAGIKPDQDYFALTCDVTPGEYVDMVISELGNIPVNSIATKIQYIQESYRMCAKPAPPRQ